MRAMRAPLPLTKRESLWQALRLRRAGMPYSAVAMTMTIYHGDPRSGNAWRKILRELGAEPALNKNGTIRVPPHTRRAES